MSGAEAGFVISLISGLISIIEATKTIYDAAKDAKGQPEEFRQVAARLRLVIEILHRAEARAQTLDEMAQEALEPILESCKAKAESLKKIFQKVIRKDDDKWYDRYKKALSALGKGDRVECLMEGILKDIQLLACERLKGTATEAQVREIEEAIKEMKEMPSSIPDEAGGQIHSGSGDNIGIFGGSGTMTINKAANDFHQNFGSKG
jgi:vacuolar-type H+-ATPase subunit E/Vma4